MSKYTEKSKQYTIEFRRKMYDSITIYVPKGQRDKIQEYAKSIGMSQNGFILELIEREFVNKQLEKESNS